jgi:uncharacterized ferritin-like protein (DUF455 family)
LVIQKKGLRNTRSGALKDPERRAEILHTFLHHELQAAELMGWALLLFPETPEEFRRGLLRIATDEIRHMGMYQRELERLGYTFGDFPVNDWFWERVPGATTPAHYVAAMGMGFEGGNLDHAQRFEDRFRAAGDEQAANTQAIVAADEQAHVAFALRWFAHFTGGQDFDEWHRHLPEPLSPLLMRGRPMNVPARRSAGFSETFLARLSQW